MLVIYILLSVASANPANRITSFFAGAAEDVTLGLGTPFLPSSATLQVSSITASPAVVWLIIGVLPARVLTEIARLLGVEDPA